MKLIRYASNNGSRGPCMIVGSYEKETTLYIYYRTRGSKVLAYVSKRHVHLEPCPFCPDNPKSSYYQGESE